MPINRALKLSKYKLFSAILLSMIYGNTYEAGAAELNAGYILNEMNTDQRVGFITGAVEGFAYSRFLKDKPDQSGAKCIYDWYAKPNTLDQVWQWFSRHPDKPAGPLLFVLIKKECGA